MQEARALIFDMDGVLIDSEPLHLKAYQVLLNSLGRDYTEEDNRQYLGRKDIEIAASLIEKLKLDFTPQKLTDDKEAILERLFKEESKAQPGVLAVLQKGKELSIPMAIASSATLPTIELVVDILSIRHYFHYLTSGDEVPHGKPAPDVYLLAAKRLGVEPFNCLVIEDTANGVKAAKAANMSCIAIACETTRHEDHSHADLRLDTMAEFDVESWYRSGMLESCR